MSHWNQNVLQSASWQMTKCSGLNYWDITLWKVGRKLSCLPISMEHVCQRNIFIFVYTTSLSTQILPLWLANWRRQWQPTPVLLPGKYHGRRSLVGCSPWGHEESDMTEQLHIRFSLSWIGEGNGNPLQCSCLENPRDGGAWWLPSMGSHRVGHDWSDLAAAAAA